MFLHQRQLPKAPTFDELQNTIMEDLTEAEELDKKRQTTQNEQEQKKLAQQIDTIIERVKANLAILKQRSKYRP